MKKYIKLFCFGLLAATVSSSFAANNTVKDARVTLTGGHIGPRETLTISTSKLIPSVIYKVVCKIHDPNNATNKIMLKAGAGNATTGPVSAVYVNGEFQGVLDPQFSLTQVDNTVEFGYVQNSARITITNLDQTDSVSVTDCFANPAAN